MYSARKILFVTTVFFGTLVCLGIRLNAEPEGSAIPSRGSGETSGVTVSPVERESAVTDLRSPRVKIENSGIPYIGKITGDQVYVRSGPAQVYYDVSQLNRGQLVVVREERHGVQSWARIDPTQQCFSWISKKYVELIGPVPVSGETEPVPGVEPTQAMTKSQSVAVESVGEKGLESTRVSTPAAKSEETGSPAPTVTAVTLDKPTSAKSAVSPASLVGHELVLGRVTGNNVRVRAGSANVPPANANQVQMSVNKGVEVHVLGERDDYYKIVSPAGCAFWVSLGYIERVGDVSPDLVAQMQRLRKISTSDGVRVETVDDANRQEYRELHTLLNIERGKPISQQDYTDIRSRLTMLLQKTKAPSLQAMAQSLERQLARCEMGLGLWRMSKRQDDRLRETLAKIDEEMELLVAVNHPMTKGSKEVVVKGRLDKSSVFTAPNQNQRFLVLDENEKIIYYATSGKEGLDLSQWLDTRVSLVGRSEYDAFGKIRILKVTSLMELPREMR